MVKPELWKYSLRYLGYWAVAVLVAVANGQNQQEKGLGLASLLFVIFIVAQTTAYMCYRVDVSDYNKINL